MHILCPHCRNPIEVVNANPREEIACPACGSSFRREPESTASWEPNAGQKLGNFELLDTVGQGAFGTVYKARDLELDRIVAVKVPRAGNLAGPQELERFLREARSVAQLRHPSIVSVHEVGQARGVPYLVCDFVCGVTLADVMSARRLGFRAAAEMIAAVAEALEYAHAQGVVHRDMKPSNIMVGDDGVPCVMDFGVAKREAGEITMTIEGQVLGTPAYMSPEQARGEGHTVDGRSDVYSLGVVLYQLLTGELPFRGTSRMLLHQVLHDDPRPLRSLNDRIPRDLETICLKAMAKEPATRYATAGELGGDLRRWLNGEAIHARPAARWERAVRWVKRRPTVAGLLVVSGVAALSLVGLAVGVFYHNELERAYQSETAARLREEKERKKAEEGRGLAEAAQKAEEVERGKAEDANRKTEAALAQVDQTAYSHSIFLADVALRENDIVQAKQRLEECKAELRGWEWYYLNGQCHTELFSFPGLVAVFSPDGTRIATVDADGAARVYDVRTGKETAVLKGPKWVGPPPFNPPVFNPEGTRIAMRGVDEVVRVYDAETGTEALVLYGPKAVSQLVYSPDGTGIVVPCADGVVRAYDALSGQEALTLKDPASIGYPAGFSPDGALIALMATSSTRQGDLVHIATDAFRVYDFRTGNEKLAIKLPAALQTTTVNIAAFSPDRATIDVGGGGRSAMFSPDGATVLVGGRGYDTSTGEERFHLTKRVGVQQDLVFSPDGEHIAYSCWAGDWEGVQICDARTGEELRALKSPGRPGTPAFSPDGTHIAVPPLIVGSGDGMVRVLEVRTGEDAFALRAPTALDHAVFSPNGTLIAATGKDGLVRVYDARGRKASLYRWGAGKGVFSPDGARTAAAEGNYGVVRIYDARTGENLLNMEGPAVLDNPVFSPDGSRIAAGPKRGAMVLEPGRLKTDDGAIRIFDARTGIETLALKGRLPLGYPAFSHDGTRIAATLGFDVQVYDAPTGKETLTAKGPAPLGDPVFSRGGTLIAAGPSTHYSGGDGAARVFDATTGEETLVLRGPAPLGDPVFSPDDKYIAIGPGEAVTGERRGDGVVRVFDAQTGHEALALKGAKPLGAPVFSPDGTRIAVAPGTNGGDGFVRLFDTRTGRETLVLKELVQNLGKPAFSPDGTRLATFSIDGRFLVVWEAPPRIGDWQAQRRENLTLGTGEWHRAQGMKTLEARQWFAAAFHLGRLCEIEPAKGQYHLNRGRALIGLGKEAPAKEAFENALAAKETLSVFERAHAYAELGNWDKAANQLVEITESPVTDNQTWPALEALALVRLELDDRTGYSGVCAIMLKRSENEEFYISSKSDAAFFCALVPWAVSDMAQVVDLAHSRFKTIGSGPSDHLALGAALYRAGKYEEAIAELTRARALLTKLHDDREKNGLPPHSPPFDLMFLAMAHQRLGRTEEARELLEESVKDIERGPPPAAWTERQALRVVQLLRHEAESLLKGTPRVTKE